MGNKSQFLIKSAFVSLSRLLNDILIFYVDSLIRDLENVDHCLLLFAAKLLI